MDFGDRQWWFSVIPSTGPAQPFSGRQMMPNRGGPHPSGGKGPERPHPGGGSKGRLR
ncbi:MAG: hypothetical protein NVSMB32_08500 [Actinomycetota bacterium]